MQIVYSTANFKWKKGIMGNNTYMYLPYYLVVTVTCVFGKGLEFESIKSPRKQNKLYT